MLLRKRILTSSVLHNGSESGFLFPSTEPRVVSGEHGCSAQVSPCPSAARGAAAEGTASSAVLSRVRRCKGGCQRQAFEVVDKTKGILRASVAEHVCCLMNARWNYLERKHKTNSSSVCWFPVLFSSSDCVSSYLYATSFSCKWTTSCSCLILQCCCAPSWGTSSSFLRAPIVSQKIVLWPCRVSSEARSKLNRSSQKVRFSMYWLFLKKCLVSKITR